MAKSWTNQLSDANELARIFYEKLGHKVPKGHRFDKSDIKAEVACWDLVALAYERIGGLDVRALSQLVQ